MLKRILKVSLIPIGYVIYFLFWLAPKKNNRYVFGAWGGQRYSDNSRYFFEYIIENHPEIEAYWVTKSEVVFQELKQRSLPVRMAQRWKTFWIVATAKVALICCSNSDVLRFGLTRRHIVAQLWHGIPLKKTALDDFKGGKLLKSSRLIPWFVNFNFTPVSSYLEQKIISNAFNVNVSKCPILGSPRSDFLKTANVHMKRNILYAPTYRPYGSYLDDFIAHIGKTEDLLGVMTRDLKIRLHFQNLKILHNRLPQSSSVFLDTSDSAEIVMMESCVLITDFSSMMFDYLLLNRPMIFYVPDLQEYQDKERDFYFDYRNHVPGPVVHTWQDVLMELKKVLIQGKDLYQDKRKMLLSQYYHFQDSNANQRIFAYLTDLIKQETQHAP